MNAAARACGRWRLPQVRLVSPACVLLHCLYSASSVVLRPANRAGFTCCELHHEVPTGSRHKICVVCVRVRTLPREKREGVACESMWIDRWMCTRA